MLEKIKLKSWMKWRKKSGKTVTRDEKVEDRMPYQYPRMIKSRSLSQMHCCLTAVLDRLQKWWLKKLQSGALALMECCQLWFFETHALLIQLSLSLSLSLSLYFTMRGSWCWEKVIIFVVVVWIMMMIIVVENHAAKTWFKLLSHNPSFRIMILASFAC